MRIRFYEITRFINIYDGFRYLVLFDYEWFDKVCDRIKYLISEKNSITNSINHSFARIGIDSYNSLPIEYSLSQLLVRIKMNTTIIYFWKKVCIKISSVQNIFK